MFVLLRGLSHLNIRLELTIAKLLDFVQNHVVFKPKYWQLSGRLEN